MKRFAEILLTLCLFFTGNLLHAQDDLWSVPEGDISPESLNGLSLLESSWEQSPWFCSYGLTMLMIKKVAGNHVIALSVDESHYPAVFYFHHIDDKKVEIDREEIPGADYSIDNRFNIVEKKGVVYYFNSDSRKEVFAYNIKKGTHEKVNSSPIDWAKIGNWRLQLYFDSPDGNLTMEIQNTDLYLNDNEAQKSETLIAREYDGEWSFGRANWNDAGDKFYFDNSGAAACIWEIDLTNRTLAKIIPDHDANDPVCLEDGRILYCQGSCVMEANKVK